MNDSIKTWEDLEEGDFIYKITEVGILPIEVKRVGIETRCGGRKTSIKVVFKSGKQINILENSNRKYYLTKEEAEQVIKEKKKNIKKKQLMYEYECKLNEEMGIDTFLINY